MNRKDNIPLTTRQLEALIRLSQARAKACLRPYVLREDAEDVVELMQASLKQVYTDEHGNVDRGRAGAGGQSKPIRKIMEALSRSGKSEFDKQDLYRLTSDLGLPLSTRVDDLIDTMRDKNLITKSAYDGRVTYKLI